VGAQVEIVLVDSRVLLRRALAHLLAAQPGLLVTGEAGDVGEALAALERLKPHVVVVNLDCPVFRAESALSDVVAQAPKPCVLAITSLADRQLQAATIAAGAAGLVYAQQPPEVLFKAIRKVHAGELWLARFETASLVRNMVRTRFEDAREAAKIALLTRREHEVINCIAEGLRNRRIAERLSISEATVRNHVSSILEKLELSDRLELVLYAFSHGLARAPQSWRVVRERAEAVVADRSTTRIRIKR